MVGSSASGSAIGMAPGARWIARIFNDQRESTVTAIHSAFSGCWTRTAIRRQPMLRTLSTTRGHADARLQPDLELDLQALRAAGFCHFRSRQFRPGRRHEYEPANNPSAFAVGGTSNSDRIYTTAAAAGGVRQASTIFPDVTAPGIGIMSSDRGGICQRHIAGSARMSPAAWPRYQRIPRT